LEHQGIRLVNCITHSVCLFVSQILLLLRFPVLNAPVVEFARQTLLLFRVGLILVYQNESMNTDPRCHTENQHFNFVCVEKVSLHCSSNQVYVQSLPCVRA